MEAKLLVTGDFCPINRVQNFVINDSESLYGDLLPHIRSSDFKITNLECPLTSSNQNIIKTGPCIKATEESIKLLNLVKFNLVTLANNHIMDYGKEGVKSTLKICSENHISTVGAGKNLQEAKAPFITSINGIKVGIINIAENEFCTATKNKYGANPLDIIENFYQIKMTRSVVDFLLVIYHGGREHYQLPTPRVRQTFRFFIHSGVDVVIGHHPHCYSGYELVNNKPIFYSLGNFIFDYKKKYQQGKWTQGLAVKITLSKNSDIKFKLLPFHQGRSNDPRLSLLKGNDKNIFTQKINELNNIIVNDDLFDMAWNDYLKSQEKIYRNLLFVKNKYFRKLLSIINLPKLPISANNHETLLLNLLKCETHHEIMKETLNKDLY